MAFQTIHMHHQYETTTRLNHDEIHLCSGRPPFVVSLFRCGFTTAGRGHDNSPHDQTGTQPVHQAQGKPDDAARRADSPGDGGEH